MAAKLFHTVFAILGITVVAFAAVLLMGDDPSRILNKHYWQDPLFLALALSHALLALFFFSLAFLRTGRRWSFRSMIWILFSSSVGILYYIYVAGWLDFDRDELSKPVWHHYAFAFAQGGIIAFILSLPASIYLVRHFFKANGRT